MRYYVVDRTLPEPHVIAETSRPLVLDLLGAYRRDEMLDHPDLAAALRRWDDGDDAEYAEAIARALVLRKLDEIEEAVEAAEEERNRSGNRPAEDGDRERLLSSTSRLVETWRRELTRTHSGRLRWDGPPPEMQADPHAPPAAETPRDRLRLVPPIDRADLLR